MFKALANYADIDRHYHNFTHIGKMLDGLNNYFPNYAFNRTLRQAILFHDVYYRPGDWNNELISANLFYDTFKSNSYQINVEEGQRLILLTKDHQTTISDTVGSIIIDLDLMGLGGSQQEYKNNSLLIRKEFKDFSNLEWQTGRIQWLEKFLARDNIYFTDYGKQNWEEPARANMRAELEYLKAIITIE